MLAVSELVTNAVCHAPGPCTLEMAAERGHVRITVSDTSRLVPRARTPQYDGKGTRASKELDRSRGAASAGRGCRLAERARATRREEPG
ncbi:ATP-binding protein [Actinospica robiniae]|uniref:ATP-binding protein n=1 Tax=Actinospica robiniae TaxID=304901 RepID=UPI00042A7250|nr:ATP-binding protein [Actinospica robiniae]